MEGEKRRKEREQVRRRRKCEKEKVCERETKKGQREGRREQEKVIVL